MNKAALKRMTRRTEFYMFIVLILLCVLVQIKSGGKLIAFPGIFTRLNVTVLRTMVVDGMFAMCSLVVMISGGFDLSFPAIAALSYSLTCTICLNNGWCQNSPVVGFLLAAAIGWVLGMLNGWIISNFKLNTMIVTLGTQTLFTGISMGLLALKEITSTLPNGFKTFGKLYILEGVDGKIRFTLSAMVIFLILLCAIVSFILNKTMFGRALYAIGGNEVSAERAGYNVRKVKFLLYSSVGALSGFVGMIRVCMESQSIPKAMVGREMTIIPAVILGGASIFGGEGTVFGTVVAVAIISLVSNSMLLLGIDTYWQQFFNGLVILVGVTVSALQAKRQKQ
ncbi:MAG: ABC transporter permease [Clostridia bacterium]|nr:ABC transporter permease [Clostridia bacterium]MBR2699145.1 ABC transporter permease [Clostridia bacterium]